MLTAFLVFVSAGAAGGFVAWRLKGSRTWREVGAVILRGGGGGEER